MRTSLLAFGTIYVGWMLICLIELIRERRAKRARRIAAAMRRHPSTRPVLP